MELKQITWLQSATGVTIAVPLDLLPDPAPEPGKTLTPDEIKAAKTKARDEAAIKANLAHLLAEEERKAEERKQFLLSNAQRVIEPLKPVLQEAFDIGFEAEQQTSTMGIKHKKKTQRDFIAKDGDTSKSGDVQDMQNAKLTKDGQVLDKKAADKAAVEVDKAYGVLRGLRGLRDELLAETIVQMVPNKAKDGLEAGPKLKLFTQDEIIEELFDPLVRSKILPDAFIEDAYSQTQAMLDATNKLYKADLTDPTKFTARGVASVSKGLVDMAAGVCTCVLEATGTINANQTTVSAALAGATQLAKLAIDTGDAIDTARRTEKFDRKGLIALLDQLPDIAGQIVGAATNDSKLQKVVASSATAAEQLVSAAISHNYDDSSKAVGQFLGNMVQSIVNGYATQPGLSTADKNRNAVISDTLGKLLSTAMAGGAPVVAKLIVSGQFAKARGQFARICLDAVAQLPTLMTDIQVQRGAAKDNLTGMVQGQTSGLGDDKVTKTDPKTGKDEVVDGKAADFTRDQNLEYVRNSDLQGGQAGTAKGAAKTLQGAIDATVAKAAPKTQKLTPEQEEAKKKLEALKKQFEQAEETDLRDEIEADAAAELKAFKAQMRGEDNPSLKQNTIDKMIADLKRDQAIMATLIAIGTGGAAVAGKFVSYAAIGTEAIQLAANAKLAYEKMRAAYEFNEELKGARETANAYGTSIDNFFKNAKFQLTVASINAAMNGVKLIVAAVAAAVPHAAPAVPAAAALSSGVNAVMGGIKQAQLKKAWQATKKALKNPKNRRLGMKARKMNPTLAKYSIAYGMMEEDPIAVSMGLACGLNEKTLKNPSTNVAKVKQYLEAKFPDDGTVVGFWEEEKGWEGDLPDPKIDTVTLAKLYKVIGTAFPAIGPIPPGSLAGLVSMVGKKLAKDAPAEDWRERSDLLKELDAMFLAAGKEAAKTADSRSIASVFAEFADLAAEQAFEAWTKAMPQGDVTA